MKRVTALGPVCFGHDHKTAKHLRVTGKGSPRASRRVTGGYHGPDRSPQGRGVLLMVYHVHHLEVVCVVKEDCLQPAQGDLIVMIK